MTVAIGNFPLFATRFRREMAHLAVVVINSFAKSLFGATVRAAAVHPSNKSAAACLNRYPSPDRSVLFKIRPVTPFMCESGGKLRRNRGKRVRNSPVIGYHGNICLDVGAQTSESVHTTFLKRGKKSCLKFQLFSLPFQSSACPHAQVSTASTQTANVPLSAPVPVVSQARFFVKAAASKAHLLAVSLVRSHATSPVAKLNQLRLDQFERRQSNALAAFFRSKDCN